MLMLHYGTPRDREAREQLAAALPDTEITEPDDVGVFEIELDADDQEHALQRVWDAGAQPHRGVTWLRRADYAQAARFARRN